MNEMTITKGKLTEKILEAPVQPGCYIFKDRQGKIIYIGKAKNIRNRVRSYLSKTNMNPKQMIMVSKIHDVEYFITNSEVEALILENTLIKMYKPKYNVCLRDDKTYPYIKITNENYPRLYITRRLLDDGSKYFGPFTDVKSLRKTLDIINKIFQIRTCKYNLTDNIVKLKKIKLCLSYHIKKCGGPCHGLVSKEEYSNMIEQVEAFINGKTDSVMSYLKNKMETAASELRFEDAARYRDQLRAIQLYSRKQYIELQGINDVDLIYFIIENNYGLSLLFRIRGGKIIGKEPFQLQNTENAEFSEIVSSFLEQYYSSTILLPDEIITNIEPENQSLLVEWLSSKKGKKIRISVPKHGEKARLLQIAEKNAKLQFEEFKYKENIKVDFVPKVLKSLKKDLNLPMYPRRIEAIDVSNIKGKQSVGSVVVFEDGKPKKSEYRKYKIKSVNGIDDYAMISEVMKRRYTRQLKEKKDLPDLILIDGGKGQLSKAVEVLKSLELENIPVIGLAKRLEEIFIPEQRDPIILPKDSLSLILLKRVRDEAHRFAITYHRKRRKKETIKSILDEIPKVGEKKKKELIKHFGSVEKIASASIEDLTTVPGIGKKLAETIWHFLHR